MTEYKRPFKGAYVETDENLTLFFQRQGCSKTINCGHEMFFVEIQYNVTMDNYSVEINYACYGPWREKFGQHKNGQVHSVRRGVSFKRAIELVPQMVAQFLRDINQPVPDTIEVSPQVMDYMYNFGINYDYCDADRILSNLCYEIETDTIRHAVHNYCVVAFTEGEFSKPVFDIDGAAKKYTPAIKLALSQGFHKCDTDKGDDYCKRRLAYLGGEYINDDFPNDRAKFVNRDMSRLDAS